MKLHQAARALLVCGLALTGCGGATKEPTTQTSLQSGSGEDHVISAVQMDAQLASSSDAPKDAQPKVPVVFQLVCYQIKVPVGTVSRNEQFWKRIDENCLDPARYDLLRRNGMRLGEAPVSELENIRNMLDETPATGRTMGTIAAEAKNIELPMKTDVPFQIVNYYNNGNELSGKSFDRSDNIFNISYQRTPRKLGDMRLAITPMVRSQKTRLEYTQMNDEVKFNYIAPVKFYLNIVANLPMDKIMVLGPSDTAELPSIIGHQFFMKDEPAEEMEQVLIFAAQPFRMDTPSVAATK